VPIDLRQEAVQQHNNKTARHPREWDAGPRPFPGPCSATLFRHVGRRLKAGSAPRKERPAPQESRRLAQGTTNTTGQEGPEDVIVSTDRNLMVACNGTVAYKATAQHPWGQILGRAPGERRAHSGVWCVYLSRSERLSKLRRPAPKEVDAEPPAAKRWRRVGTRFYHRLAN